MSNVCVCIEGQLRGAKRCGPTIEKHLVKHLNADLYFCLQNYDKHNEENLKYYGNYKEKIIYENPEPDFSDTFNNLCKRFGFEENSWKDNFKLPDNNFSLGFKKPGTCIRRMYNRYIIYKMLRKIEYDWFVLLRSDLYFVDNFYDISEFNNKKLTVCNIGHHDGINNNLIVFNKDLFDKILTYIKNFISKKFYNWIIENNLDSPINEEKFFMYNMILNGIEFNQVRNMWYISADGKDETTTWQSIKIKENGDIYKYECDYNEAMLYLKETKHDY